MNGPTVWWKNGGGRKIFMWDESEVRQGTR